MDKKGRFTIWLISIVALTMSVASVCVACFRTGDLGFDYQGVIVGVLSLLVTALIGWQIYSTIAMEERMRKIAERIVSHKADEIKVEFYRSLADTYNSLTLSSIKANKPIESILYLNNQFTCVLRCNDMNQANNVITNMMGIIKKFKDECRDNKELKEILKAHIESMKILLGINPGLADSYLNLKTYYNNQIPTS